MTRNVTTAITVAVIAAALLCATTLGNSAYASSKKYSVKLEFHDGSGYKGKLFVTVKNVDTGENLGKTTIDFKKLNQEQFGVFHATAKFSKKGSHTGDLIAVCGVASDHSGSWCTQEFTFKSKQKTYNEGLGLEDIGCNNCG